MLQRGRSNNTNRDWDPMKEDYNNSYYDPQYPDDESSGGVQLDHTRLYIRNIPKSLNEDGLRSAFSKFGTVTHVFLSHDPNKRYGMVTYESPGEAKLAMMKLNTTEPLRLNITIAHKSKSKKTQEKRQRDNKDQVNFNGIRKNKEETSSIGTQRRTPRDDCNENDNDVEENSVESDLVYDINPDLHLELENLKLEQLQLKEAQLQCKQRMLLLRQSDKRIIHQNTTTNRSIMPDGKIVVRNVDRSQDRDAMPTVRAGVGDPSNIPALQRDSSRACVVCGQWANSFCARCELTPYCSTGCQRRDWLDRHRAVCHNLARLTKIDLNDSVERTPPAQATVMPPAPLRQPRSPTKRSEEVVANENKKVFVPPSNATHQPQGNRGRGAKYINNTNRQNNVQRQPYKQLSVQDDEDWGVQVSPNKQPEAKSLPMKKEPHVSTGEPEVAKRAPGLTEKVPPPKKESQLPKKELQMPKKEPQISKVQANNTTAPGSLNDVTPKKIFVPKNYLIELLSIGDSVLISVDALASECRSKRPGFVCLSMHEKYQIEYENLCTDYVLHCEADKEEFKASAGEVFSYLNQSDGGWYRARQLSATSAALLDGGKVITVTATDQCKKLGEPYVDIPEFCCLLDADKVKIGDNLKCTIVSKTPVGYKVEMADVDSGALIGEGVLSRWIPEVEIPATVTVQTNGTTATIPEVSRPDVTNNSRVCLVDMTAFDKVFVRPADIASQKLFEEILQDVLLYGRNATPLKEPPNRGDTVIAKFNDGIHYRALCKRTNVKQDKYLIEYIEFGNMEVTNLESLYPCPPQYQLPTAPTQVSLITLANSEHSLTLHAVEYINQLKDSQEELVLTITSGDKIAPTGSLVTLTIAKNNQCVNKKVQEMCTPDWKKMEDKGIDVVETEPLMYKTLEYLELPVSGCKMEVLDISTLESGMVSGCQAGIKHARYVMNELIEKMGEYCNSSLGREPYLPKLEELCIAQCPPYPQWFRAVLLEQASGPGGDTASLCFIDYGNVETVPVSLIRKMLPEFVKGLPALASHIEIKNFLKSPTPNQLARAIQYMKVNEEGRGELLVQRIEKHNDTDGMYLVDVPDLIAHIA